jgi:hypothetical protein
MKRCIEALVVIGMAVAVVVMAIAGLGGLAGARPLERADSPVVSPVAKLKGNAWLTRFSPGGHVMTAAKFHVTASFSTDHPGAPLLTIRKAVVFFPDHAGTNGRLFPSCDARQIERYHGIISRCPKGARLGGGTVKAQVAVLGITATGRVTMFNGHHGRSITFNVQATSPAQINASFDAPLRRLHGRYGEQLTIADPASLWQVLPGVFVGVQTFDVTVGAAILRHGVGYGYLKARTCPKWAIHGVFDFIDPTTGRTATTTADAKVHCTTG